MAAGLQACQTRVLFVISTKDTACPYEQEGPFFDTLTELGIRVQRTEWSHNELYEKIVMGGTSAYRHPPEDVEVFLQPFWH